MSLDVAPRRRPSVRKQTEYPWHLFYDGKLVAESQWSAILHMYVREHASTAHRYEVKRNVRAA